MNRSHTGRFSAGHRKRFAALIIVLCCSAPNPARAEYRLASGDTLELSVAGMPDLHQRTVVQIDGTISVPVVGTVQVAGLSPRQVQSTVEGILTNKVLRQRGSDGRERQILLQPGDTAITVIEYRPIVVSGDVQTPGQYPFRPMMTVRQALALSGGPSLLRGSAATAGVDVAEYDRQRKTILLDYAREIARFWRLEAELQGVEEIKQKSLDGVSVPQSALAEFVRIETRTLKVGLSNLARERAYLSGAIVKADEQIASLTTQEQEERRGAEADSEELDRLTRLLGSGSVVTQRVTDTRRAVLLSSTRRLQTSTRLAEVKQLRDEFVWRQSKLDSQHELELLRDLREQRGKLDELIVRLDGAKQKLAFLGGIHGVIIPGTAATVVVTIIRRSGSEWTRIAGSEETELQPGDALEVKQKQGLEAAIETH
ncbi:polysaccharide biosynthesis/export family protein [Methylobacterium sp. CM6257]